MTALAWVALAAALAVVYVASCWWWPFTDCGCCGGRGTHSREQKGKTKRKRVFRDCRGWRCWPRGCRGAGRKLRIGRRVWNRFASIRDRAS